MAYRPDDTWCGSSNIISYVRPQLIPGGEGPPDFESS
jgi:hypothetical protein